MARAKSTKTAAAKKSSARLRQTNITTPPADTSPTRPPLPFPYEVKTRTTRQTIAGFLEEEVAKHYDTNLKLQEALERLAALEGGNGSTPQQPANTMEGTKEREGGDEGMAGYLRGGGQAPEDDDEDPFDEDIEMEQWGGIGEARKEDDGLAGKVNSLERSLATIAQGLQGVTENMARGFQQLAAANKDDRDSVSPISVRGKRDSKTHDAYDSDGSSIRYTGGESEWEKLLSRYDTAGEKEMRAISKGDLVPEKLYLCIPRDSELFPDVTENTDKLRFDAKGAYLEQKGSVPYEKAKVFRTLHEAIPSPIHFQHAWGWFMILVNYRYKNPALLSAMMQFGCEVVQYDSNYRWTDCLKMYINLARPILRGNLDDKIKMFKEADFALSLSKFPRIERLRPATSAPLAPGTPVMYTPVYIDGVEICRKYNKGQCDTPCINKRVHACVNCKSFSHRAHQCGTPQGPAAFTANVNQPQGSNLRIGHNSGPAPNRYFNSAQGPAYGRTSGRDT